VTWANTTLFNILCFLKEGVEDGRMRNCKCSNGEQTKKEGRKSKGYCKFVIDFGISLLESRDKGCIQQTFFFFFGEEYTTNLTA